MQALLADDNIRFQGHSDVAAIDYPMDRQEWTLTAADGRLLACADLVVVCAGSHSRSWAPEPLGLKPIRGQVLIGKALSAIDSEALFPVNGHGSWVPHFIADDGVPSWIMGSTFERDCDALPPSAADAEAGRAENWQKLQTLLPAAAQRHAADMPQASNWAQVRCASHDRRPVVGPVPAAGPHLWVHTALGSRGLTWALLCAEMLAARLHGEPLPLPNDLALSLATDRFLPPGA